MVRLPRLLQFLGDGYNRGPLGQQPFILTMTWYDCQGNPCPRRGVVFVCQCMVLFTVIAVCHTFPLPDRRSSAKRPFGHRWLVVHWVYVVRDLSSSGKRGLRTVTAMSMESSRRSGTIVMTLPSNSSMSLYPSNKASDYRVQLPAPLRLDENWEVGLTGFHYSRTWFNVPGDGIYAMRILFSLQDKPVCRTSIPPGQYSSPRELVEALGNDDDCSRLVRFNYSDQDQRVTVTLLSAWALQVDLSPDLAQKLGWAHEKVSLHLSAERNWIKAPGIVNLEDIDMIFVNCDLAANSHYVGDRMVPILKTISPAGTYSDFVQYEPLVIDWLPLRSHTIGVVHVLITDATGRHVSFETGRCSVKIHIRQSKLFWGVDIMSTITPYSGATWVWSGGGFSRIIPDHYALGQKCRSKGPKGLPEDRRRTGIWRPQEEEHVPDPASQSDGSSERGCRTSSDWSKPEEESPA